MAHLRPEAHDLVLLPAAERLARIPANRWIGYTRANQAITLLSGACWLTSPAASGPATC
jgi:hypothetical protein